MAVNAITNIKLDIISDFDQYVKRLNIGYKDNYDLILHKISFIQAYQALDKIEPIYEFLINN